MKEYTALTNNQNMLAAEKSVRKTIDEHNLIWRGDVLVLGLSGGPDSLCLLNILLGLQKELGFVLCALHFNHCVRGAEADEDEAYLRAYCAQLGVPLKVVKEDIPSLAKEQGMSVEECGRKRRQEALLVYADEIADAWNLHPELLPEGAAKECIENAKNYEIHPRVVLAHNADDQAETVLLRIIRGTGVHGLAAMRYMREDGLIRPLLDTARSDIEDYCRQKGLEPRIDKTNASTDYLRNKVRLELLPELAKINPNIKNCLGRLADNAAADDGFINDEALGWLQDHKPTSWKPSEIGKDYLSEERPLLIRDLRGLSPALFNRIVRIKFEQIGLNEDIAAVHINALTKAIYTNVGNKTIEFPKGYTAYINHGELWFRVPENK